MLWLQLSEVQWGERIIKIHSDRRATSHASRLRHRREQTYLSVKCPTLLSCQGLGQALFVLQRTPQHLLNLGPHHEKAGQHLGDGSVVRRLRHV